MNKLLVYSLTIGIGLLISAEYAEWPVNIWCIGLFIWLYHNADRKERIEMLTVLAFATPMELFFSEVWLIYEYQRGLMPLFVPVGHWFLFDTGRILSRYLPGDKALLTLVPFIPLVLYGVYTGGDTSGVFLLVLVLCFTKWGPQPLCMQPWLGLLLQWRFGEPISLTGHGQVMYHGQALLLGTHHF